MEDIVQWDKNQFNLIQLASEITTIAKLVYAEFELILVHPELELTHKLIWLIIALKGAMHPELVCVLSDKELTESLGKKGPEIYPYLEKLEVMGLIRKLAGAEETALYSIYHFPIKR